MTTEIQSGPGTAKPALLGKNFLYYRIYSSRKHTKIGQKIDSGICALVIIYSNYNIGLTRFSILAWHQLHQMSLSFLAYRMARHYLSSICNVLHWGQQWEELDQNKCSIFEILRRHGSFHCADLHTSQTCSKCLVTNDSHASLSSITVFCRSTMFGTRRLKVGRGSLCSNRELLALASHWCWTATWRVSSV